MLELSEISRRFGKVIALDKASFRLRSGTIHALLGENGAGKTTLMRVAFGMLAPDSGTIRIDESRVSFSSPADALKSGIGMVHQHFSLVPAMTVAENVALGGRGWFDPDAAAQRVSVLADRTGLRVDPSALVSSLSVGAQQRCEIIKALARDVRVLILDEPTAVLAPAEARELMQWARRFVDGGTHSIVLITHSLRDALEVSDDITVLRHGRVVLQKPRVETDISELAAAMLGEEVEGRSSTNGDTVDDTSSKVGNAAVVRDNPEQTARTQPVVRATSLSVIDGRGVLRVLDVDLELYPGEIVGIAAVDGAGQHELLMAIAGRTDAAGGSLVLPKKIGFVPEDRHRDALMLDESAVENVTLRDLADHRGVLDRRRLRVQTEAIVREFDVRGITQIAETPVRSLSGGNQQKLVIGRELSELPTLLVVENPTRGLDIRASESVRSALREAREKGVAILFYSTDLDEVLSLSNRLFVLHRGRLSAVPMDRESVGRAMIGAV